MSCGRLKGTIVAVAVVGAVVCFAGAALAQPAELPRRVESYEWTSGTFDGAGDLGSEELPEPAVSDVIRVPGVPWIQLTFDRVHLGAKSQLVVRSLADGAVQILDKETLRQWQGRSAYFNGDAVEVQLFVGPRDRAVRVAIREVVVGVTDGLGAKSICGVDNRVASTEPRVARIDPIGCTGWIASNGKYLTAGHCLAGGSSNNILSFNVPPSLSNGTVQFPPPQDQYSIDQSSFQFTNGGVGNDWGIFEVFDNSQTGLQPIEAQGSFNVKQDLGPSNIRITGFGTDSGSTNQTNQTHVGPNAGSSGTTMRYATDTTGGNSGSPVIDNATGQAVGIHTHGGCSSGGGNNNGTSFFNSALWNALDVGGGPGPGVDCPAGSIDFDSFALTSYADQNVTNDVDVEDDGDILRLTGNTWVRSTQVFDIGPDTVVEFQFASSTQGEIHALGFDDDAVLNDEARHFHFWGTQNWTGGGRIDWTPKYSGGGSFQSYSIPVGQHYTGPMWLVFTNDQDSGTLTNHGRFACVRVLDEGTGGSCDVEEGFESGLGGWTTSGNCTTGAFTTGDPDPVSDGGVVTQVNGPQSGNAALFTQPNLAGAGTDDVDGGECVATSPVYSVTADSEVSLWWFHGQRDQGDDPGGDYFVIERSLNGGAFQALQSIGDTTTNAAWTELTSSAAAGSTVRLRVRASDGAGPGDLVEAGIDTLRICEP